MTNEVIARRLQLEAREMDVKPQYVQSAKAFRRAAMQIQDTHLSLQDLFENQGETSLQELPGVGKRIAERIAGYIRFEKTLDLLKNRSRRLVPSRN